MLPTLTATGILTTSSAVTSLEIALPSALPVTFKVPAQLGTTVYSYSPAPHVLEEYTLIDGVTLSSTASDVASPLLSDVVNLISVILTPIFLATITPTTTVPSSCTDVKSLAVSFCVCVPFSVVATASYPSLVFLTVNVYSAPTLNIFVPVNWLNLTLLLTLSTPSLFDVSADV